MEATGSPSCCGCTRPSRGKVVRRPSRLARRCSAATIGPICWRNSAAGRRRPGRNTRSWPNSSPRTGRRPRPPGAARWNRLKAGLGGLLLLARAAPRAKHRDNYSALFDLETMEPMVASPPFVEALEQLAAAARVGPADPLGYDPTAARAVFWRGECGMAIADGGARRLPRRRSRGRATRRFASASWSCPAGNGSLTSVTTIGTRGRRRTSLHVPLLSVSGSAGLGRPRSRITLTQRSSCSGSAEAWPGAHRWARPVR